MKKVLLITYYWPPAAGPGVHRWLRMSRYMHEFGYDLTVYTPENPHYQQVDPESVHAVYSGLKIIKQPIFEITRLAEKLSGKKTGTALLNEKKTGKLSSILMKIRGNFFIPDPKVLWVNSSVDFLLDYIQKNKIETVISTGPPHSLHLIGQQLKLKLGIKWVADFRDPWTNIDFYKELRLGHRADAKHRKLEKAVLEQADLVTVVGETMKFEMEALGAKNCAVITNGFEFGAAPSNPVYPAHFTIAHYGSMPAARNPQALWDALKELKNEGTAWLSQIQIRLVGTVDYAVKQAIDQAGIAELVHFSGGLSHAQSIESQNREAVLLLVANNTPNAKGILTGKFFEYLNTGRPILALGPIDGDLAMALKKTGAGEIFDYDHKEDIKKMLNRLFNDFKAGSLIYKASAREMYATRYIVKLFCAELDKLGGRN